MHERTQYQQLQPEERLIIASLHLCRLSITMAARVASRRNVTRRIVVVFAFFFFFFRGLPGAERAAPGDFQLLRNLHFGWRISGLSQAAQNKFFYALCSPRLDPTL
ncbi:hypothetical protein OKW41_004273 [Paraburkholderia sp. UCT70]